MVGIATLAMVESRTCINVANERAIVIHASFDPVKGAVVTIAPHYLFPRLLLIISVTILSAGDISTANAAVW